MCFVVNKQQFRCQHEEYSAESFVKYCVLARELGICPEHLWQVKTQLVDYLCDNCLRDIEDTARCLVLLRDQLRRAREGAGAGTPAELFAASIYLCGGTQILRKACWSRNCVREINKAEAFGYAAMTAIQNCEVQLLPVRTETVSPLSKDKI